MQMNLLFQYLRSSHDYIDYVKYALSQTFLILIITKHCTQCLNFLTLYFNGYYDDVCAIKMMYSLGSEEHTHYLNTKAI
jgi:hypothetical protein